LSWCKRDCFLWATKWTNLTTDTQFAVQYKDLMSDDHPSLKAKLFVGINFDGRAPIHRKTPFKRLNID
jgi:hypothetical protein